MPLVDHCRREFTIRRQCCPWCGGCSRNRFCYTIAWLPHWTSWQQILLKPEGQAGHVRCMVRNDTNLPSNRIVSPMYSSHFPVKSQRKFYILLLITRFALYTMAEFTPQLTSSSKQALTLLLKLWKILVQWVRLWSFFFLPVAHAWTLSYTYTCAPCAIMWPETIT